MLRNVNCVVFSGGGNRCVWQAGFWSEAAPHLGLAPARIAAASAGAAMACVLFAGRFEHALAHFKAATAANRRNVYPANALRGRRVFPHWAMYRQALLEAIDDDALARLHRGPDIVVPITRKPAWLGVRSAFAVAGLADALEHAVAPSPHPHFARRLGFRAEYARVRDCATPEALADLVLASSCTPPLTPRLAYGGRPALDGGIADNVPVEAAGEGPTLVLLSRRFRQLPAHAARLYVQPSQSVPVASWDYTDPDGLQAAFDLGRRDGEAFARGAPR
ncbi:MAG TPA: patatin-like phospholipase family protein [Burkholderiales bacterium]|nr:patatin-like phospholipase family protein [Burkholderiales bacterium]